MSEAKKFKTKQLTITKLPIGNIKKPTTKPKNTVIKPTQNGKRKFSQVSEGE